MSTPHPSGLPTFRSAEVVVGRLKVDTDSLPDDIALCQEMIQALVEENAKQLAANRSRRRAATTRVAGFGKGDRPKHKFSDHQLKSATCGTGSIERHR